MTQSRQRLILQPTLCSVHPRIYSCAFSFATLLAGLLSAAPMADCYVVEDIPFPPEVAAEVGGIGFDANGLIYVGLRRGDVLTAMPNAIPSKFDWKVFATGFDNTGGLVVVAPGRIVVAQMPELTEATDTNGDGRADRYRTLSDAWGLSGNYHETTALTTDGHGGYFVALGTASHRSPTFVYTRGEYSAIGRRGRNYSALKYRGWTMHVKVDGSTEAYSSGFRVPNGVLYDDEGNLWASDNQGDWKATTPLYLLQKGNFYGHPSSLVWDPKWPAEKDPLATFRADLAAYNGMRTYASVEVPYMELLRSGSQPIQIPRNGAFGPFGGQILLADAASKHIARIMPEKVEGEYQGAVTLFINEQGLRVSNNRLAFSPDGRSLYVGQTSRGWGATRGTDTEGMQRISWRGAVPFTIEQMTITPRGFRLTFTGPVNAAGAQASGYTVNSSTYQSRWVYGGDPENTRDHVVTGVQSIDLRTVEISIASFQPGRVYRLRLGAAVTSAVNEALSHPDYYYTANRIPKG